jgi:hypothetical protein
MLRLSPKSPARTRLARPTLEGLERRELLSIATLPRPDHVVIVIEENHAYNQIIGSSAAPYINSLARQGALFTQSYALSHPSQPNYLQLFSGSNQGVTTDNCLTSPRTTPNLGAELLQNGYTFAGYSEDLPAVGSTVCTSGQYARKHNPWVNWQGASANAIPAGSNLRLSDFPSDYSTLPTVSFVIPNQNNDMHNGSDPATITQGDTWLRSHLDGYVQWAQNNNSLLIVTFDEDNSASGNRIATLFLGPMVAPGQYAQHITHYDVLRTVEDLYGLPYAGASASATPITNAWASPWQEQDVGSVGQAGGSLEWDVYGSYFLQGAGAGIGGSADAFHYVYQPLHGDGWVQAEVGAVDYTDPGALAGLTIREDLSAGAKQATIALRADGGSQFLSRSAAGGASDSASGPYLGAPATLYLERAGDTLSGWTYTDATGWVNVGSVTISMAGDVYLGLAVTSNTTATLANASFDSVSYSVGAAPAPAPAPRAARPAGGSPAGSVERDAALTNLAEPAPTTWERGLAGEPASPIAPGREVVFPVPVPLLWQAPEEGAVRRSDVALLGRDAEAERALLDGALFAAGVDGGR